MAAALVAMWDLIGKALGVPVYSLFGRKLRDKVAVYANINRATKDRTPEGFAKNAREATSSGEQNARWCRAFRFHPHQSTLTIGFHRKWGSITDKREELFHFLRRVSSSWAFTQSDQSEICFQLSNSKADNSIGWGGFGSWQDHIGAEYGV